MSDPYGFRALIRAFDSEQSEKYKAQIAAGVDAEREEEIRAWFSLQQARARLRETRLRSASLTDAVGPGQRPLALPTITTRLTDTVSLISGRPKSGRRPWRAARAALPARNP
jgi:hypothetical protein